MGNLNSTIIGRMIDFESTSGKRGRVDDGAGLENRKGCKPLVGSNPTASATMIEQISMFDPPIYRYDSILSFADCDRITQYICDAKKDNHKAKNMDELPWVESDNISWNDIQDSDVKKIISAYKYRLAQAISMCYNNIIVYPYFTDIVLWRNNRCMDYHLDSGYVGSSTEDPARRIYTTVAYMNDTYDGGKTLIRGDSTIYESVPMQGSVIIFPSNLLHSATKVTTGQRITLATWFTESAEYCE